MRTYTEAEIVKAIEEVKKETQSNPTCADYEYRRMNELSEEVGMTKLLCKLIQNHQHDPKDRQTQ